MWVMAHWSDEPIDQMKFKVFETEAAARNGVYEWLIANDMIGIEYGEDYAVDWWFTDGQGEDLDYGCVIREAS